MAYPDDMLVKWMRARSFDWDDFERPADLGVPTLVVDTEPSDAESPRPNTSPSDAASQ